MLGDSAWVAVAESLDEIARSAKFASSLGESREGLTSAAVASCGRGRAILLVGSFCADHSSTAGIGVSCRGRRLGGISGCTSVRGAGVRCAICRGTGAGAAGFLSSDCVFALGHGPGYRLSLAASRSIRGSGLCRSRRRTEYRSVIIMRPSILGTDMICQEISPNIAPCARVESTKEAVFWLGCGRWSKIVIVWEDLISG